MRAPTESPKNRVRRESKKELEFGNLEAPTFDKKKKKKKKKKQRQYSTQAAAAAKSNTPLLLPLLYSSFNHTQSREIDHVEGRKEEEEEEPVAMRGIFPDLRSPSFHVI